MMIKKLKYSENIGMYIINLRLSENKIILLKITDYYLCKQKIKANQSFTHYDHTVKKFDSDLEDLHRSV